MADMAVVKTQINKVDILKRQIDSASIQEQFRRALGDGAELFMASVVEIFSGDTYLQNCDPGDVLKECLKAATLKLPINKQLGQAYVIAYKGKPQFQIGYKGYMQLARRTAKYRYINADVVYEGELKKQNKLTGEIDISGEPVSENIVGYFAHIETVDGFRKTIFWSKERVKAHGKKFSQSFGSASSPWHTNFDAMGIKTVLKYLLSHYAELPAPDAERMEEFEAFMSDVEEGEVDSKPAFYANTGEVLTIDTNTGEVIDADNKPETAVLPAPDAKRMEEFEAFMSDVEEGEIVVPPARQTTGKAPF